MSSLTPPNQSARQLLHKRVLSQSAPSEEADCTQKFAEYTKAFTNKLQHQLTKPIEESLHNLQLNSTPAKSPLLWDSMMQDYLESSEHRGAILSVFSIYQGKLKRQEELLSEEKSQCKQASPMVTEEDLEKIHKAETVVGSRKVSSFLASAGVPSKPKGHSIFPCKVNKKLFKEEKEKELCLEGERNGVPDVVIPHAPHKKKYLFPAK
jgi:hypothetical protein